MGLSATSTLKESIDKISDKLTLNLNAANEHSNKNLDAAKTYTNSKIEELDYSDKVIS